LRKFFFKQHNLFGYTFHIITAVYYFAYQVSLGIASPLHGGQSHSS
jgi:hypothetical protein